MRGPRTAMNSGPGLPHLEKALAQKRRPNIAINQSINQSLKIKKCICCKDTCSLDQHAGGAGGTHLGISTRRDPELGAFGMMRHLQKV